MGRNIKILEYSLLLEVLIYENGEPNQTSGAIQTTMHDLEKILKFLNMISKKAIKGRLLKK